jgi:DMSO/TMAO reductase YedYZ molybdopterin-dependent catalytic subunit
MYVPRREFLGTVAGLMSQALFPGRHWAEARFVKNPCLIKHWNSPNFLETPLQELGKSWITPNDLFFVLSHTPMTISAVEAGQWQMAVRGLAENPQQFPIRNILDPSQFQQSEFPAYLQCCGNGRRFFKPERNDLPWGHGAIGNAVWGGIRLAELLNAVRPRSNVKYITFVGKDGLLDQQKPYVKSIPIAKAMEPHTILATRMNGSALPVMHGGPVRLIVPGWGGTYSVKWLTDVIIEERPWTGFWMEQAYRVPIRPMTPESSVSLSDTKPFTEFSVNSMITQPGDRDLVTTVPTQVQGFAWAGETEVESVKVSTDEGQTWYPATLQPRHIRYAWKQWGFAWHPKPGSYTLMARARDATGNLQPMRQDNWNPGGYGWNAVHSIQVNVT